jgi:hypothetical protein
VVVVFGVADLALDLGTGARVTMRQPWTAMGGFVAVLLVLALGHRLPVTASWFTSDKTCRERHAAPWLVNRLDIDCGRLLRERCGSFMTKADLAVHVGGRALLTT